MKKINNVKNIKTIEIITCIGLSMLYFVIYYNFITVRSGSDFPLHIEAALNNAGYSLMSYVIRLIYSLPGSQLLLSIFMMATTVASGFAIKMLMDTVLLILGVEKKASVSLVSGMMMLFVCKLCLPEWSPSYYIGSFVTQPWHNSTYTLMRMFALFVMAYFFMIQAKYMEKIELKQFVLFTVLLFLTNFAKPSFVIAFAPVMLVTLIYDFIKTKTKSFKNAFIFGTGVLISCTILVYQTMVLFPAGEGGGVAISLANGLSYITRDLKFPLYILLNYAYPLVVLYYFVKNYKTTDKQTRRIYIQAWAMNILSLFEMLFVVETGSRADDGNFGWGMLFFGLLLFVISYCVFRKLRKDKKITSDEYAVGNTVYYLHIFTGIMYSLLIALNFTIYYI